MSLLRTVTTTRSMKMPRIVVHGPSGVGKTTFAASFPAPIFLPIEEGLATLKVSAFPEPQTFDEVMQAIHELRTQPHEFKTLVIDAIDELEPMVWAKTTDTKLVGKVKKDHIEDYGYAKGYSYAEVYWDQFFKALDGLRAEKRMFIIVIAHDEVKTVEDTIVGSYDRWQPKLHKKACADLIQWCDIGAFIEMERMRRDVDGSGEKTRTSMVTGKRQLHLEDGGHFWAKNRYGMRSPLDVPRDYPCGPFREAMIQAINPPASEPQAVAAPQ